MGEMIGLSSRGSWKPGFRIVTSFGSRSGGKRP
jgi:hypothetical protein